MCVRSECHCEVGVTEQALGCFTVKHLLAFQSNVTERAELRKWFRSLSDLRGKERSLLHGDYYSLASSANSLAFLRLWDQSERFITAVNWGAGPEALRLDLKPAGKLQFDRCG